MRITSSTVILDDERALGQIRKHRTEPLWTFVVNAPGGSFEVTFLELGKLDALLDDLVSARMKLPDPVAT